MIDMRNAFNSLKMDSFLSVARVRTPGLYNLLWQAYSSPTRFFFCAGGGGGGLPQRQASSRETQSDLPFLLYQLMKHPEVSSLNLMYDIWTMLPSETPRRGFTTILWYYWRGSEQLALRSMEANMSSSFSMTAYRRNGGPVQRAPSGGLGGWSVWPFTARSPGGYIQVIPETIHEKREALERMTSKLEVLNPHRTFVLLKNAFAIPKLQYVMRASPAYCVGRSWASSTWLFLII